LAINQRSFLQRDLQPRRWRARIVDKDQLVRSRRTVTHAGIAKVKRWAFSMPQPELAPNVCCWENSGKHLLTASISPFDPERTSMLF
jgi:hypothetical protein